MSTSSVTFVGRVRVDDDPYPKAIRIRTDGRAPGPDDEVEPIADPFGDPLGDPWQAVEAPMLDDGPRGPLSRYVLAPPVRARKVIGVGRNYAKHAAEMGNEVPDRPLLFFKSPTCLLASGQPIPLPRGYERIDMESELVVVIGRAASKVSEAEAWQHVAGYTLGNDVSCRDLQKADKQWTRAKGFDGFGPCGPFVRLIEPGTALDGTSLRIRGYLDDELRQDGSVADMIFSIPTLIAHLSECMTLEPGDLIYTGTPEGVSPLGVGQRVRIELEGMDLGRLVNPIV